MQLHDSSYGAHNRSESSPLRGVWVVTFLQQVLPTGEVWVFKENPAAPHDPTGLDFRSEQFFLYRPHVFCQLVGLSSEVWTVKQLQPGWPFGLKHKQSRGTEFNPKMSIQGLCFHFAVRWVTYTFDHSAGPDTVVKAHPAAVVVVVPWADDVLVAHEVVALIQAPPAAVHSDRVASSDVAMQVGWVAPAVIGLPLEVPVLEEHDLKEEQQDLTPSSKQPSVFSPTGHVKSSPSPSARLNAPNAVTNTELFINGRDNNPNACVAVCVTFITVQISSRVCSLFNTHCIACLRTMVV